MIDGTMTLRKFRSTAYKNIWSIEIGQAANVSENRPPKQEI
jgi:hypothetical protein